MNPRDIASRTRDVLAAAAAANLSHLALRVWLVLATAEGINRDTGEVEMGLALIAKKAKSSTTAVSRAVDELRLNAWIDTPKVSRGRRTVYRLAASTFPKAENRVGADFPTSERSHPETPPPAENFGPSSPPAENSFPNSEHDPSSSLSETGREGRDRVPPAENSTTPPAENSLGRSFVQACAAECGRGDSFSAPGGGARDLARIGTALASAGVGASDVAGFAAFLARNGDRGLVRSPGLIAGKPALLDEPVRKWREELEVGIETRRGADASLRAEILRVAAECSSSRQLLPLLGDRRNRAAALLTDDDFRREVEGQYRIVAPTRNGGGR